MKRYEKKRNNPILRTFGQMVLASFMLLSLNTWAVTSGFVDISEVELPDTSWVTITVSNSANLNTVCSGELQFQYTADTLSEIYYAMLMTAKSTGIQIKLGYVEPVSPATYCELNRVELYQ